MRHQERAAGYLECRVPVPAYDEMTDRSATPRTHLQEALHEAGRRRRCQASRQVDVAGRPPPRGGPLETLRRRWVDPAVNEGAVPRSKGPLKSRAARESPVCITTMLRDRTRSRLHPTL